MITPPLGREMDTSRQPCGYSPGDTDADTCMRPATWHIAWDVAMENGLACDEHMASAKKFAYVDRHPVGADCSMPGSAWFFEEQRCGYPDEAPVLQLAEALTVPTKEPK
ncbi:MAG TPA: hypothetical protein VK698_39480 [Kofleriaceae bacterium]|nr:hypothetical protein [Kofleriaceae bacterium]